MKRGQRGFTLVELVVAMVLLATMLLALASCTRGGPRPASSR